MGFLFVWGDAYSGFWGRVRYVLDAVSVLGSESDVLDRIYIILGVELFCFRMESVVIFGGRGLKCIREESTFSFGALSGVCCFW